MTERRAAALAALYRRAEESMADLPLYNPALGVEITAFRAWDAVHLGVAITPWSMTLIALPDDHSTGPAEDVHLSLPCGRVRLVAAHAAEVGPYLTCALFSVMTEFPDMDTARAVAVACLDEAMREPGAATPAAPSQVSRRTLFGLGNAQDVR